MAERISFNKARKRLQREQKARDAARNRVRHGRSKAEKARERSQREADDKRLDGHRREVGGVADHRGDDAPPPYPAPHPALPRPQAGTGAAGDDGDDGDDRQ